MRCFSFFLYSDLFANLIFDYWDFFILAVSFISSGAIFYEDLRKSEFHIISIFIFGICGVVWCFKQSFIPLAIIPISIMTAIFLISNRVLKRITIAPGDLVAMGICCCFIPFSEFSLFIMLCGGFGIAEYAILYILKKRQEDSEKIKQIPFAPAIIAAFWITFLLYCI